MDPEELEFIGENITIGIIPNFNFDSIHLIAGTVGKKVGLKYLFLLNIDPYF